MFPLRATWILFAPHSVRYWKFELFAPHSVRYWIALSALEPGQPSQRPGLGILEPVWKKNTGSPMTRLEIYMLDSV